MIMVWAFYSDPKIRTKTDPKNSGPGSNRTDVFTLFGFVVEDPQVLDPTQPESETRWVPKNSSIYLYI